MLNDLIKEQNNCIRTENSIIRQNIGRLNNFINGHKNDKEIESLFKDLQMLLCILENQRNLISSLEKGLENHQIEYENLLEKSLQNARIYSNKPYSSNCLAELVAKEEDEVNELQQQLRIKITQSAKEISECKSLLIHQNAELKNSNSVLPSKSPSIHKSGVRLNEQKKNKYLPPLE